MTMVDAISSRMVGVTFFAFKGPNGDARPQQIDPDKLPDHSIERSQLKFAARHTQVTDEITFSSEAWDRLKAMQSQPSESRAIEMPAGGMTPEEASLTMTLAELNAQISALDRAAQMRDARAATLTRLQNVYVKMRDTPPEPRITLNKADAAKALQMLKDAGQSPRGESYGFVKDGIQYNFMSDGTVTTQKEGVATSRERQQETLAAIERGMSFLSGLLEDTTSQRSTLVAETDALAGKNLARVV